MALLDARCTSCGAALKVNGGLDAANCEFCGAAFIVEKAVQNFYEENLAQQKTTKLPNTKRKAKLAIAFGLISCFIAILSALGIVSVFPIAAEFRYGGEGVFISLAWIAALGIFLSIPSVVLSTIARREQNLQNRNYTSVGYIFSWVGLCLSVVITTIIFVIYLDYALELYRFFPR